MSILIRKTCASAFFFLCNVCHIRKFLSTSSTEKLVHACITSRIDNCNSLLYGLPNNLISKLQCVQNAGVRLVWSLPKFCDVSPLLKDLHWLPVKQRVDFKIILITFKILHNVAAPPPYLSCLISFKSASCYNRRSALDNTLLQMLSSRSFKTSVDRAFMFAVPRLWNSLPSDIRCTTNLSTFKSKLRTFLFRQAFSWIILMCFYPLLYFIANI